MIADLWIYILDSKLRYCDKQSALDIEPTTEIFELYKVGIVLDWFYYEWDSHGMYDDENILCEYDLECD